MLSLMKSRYLFKILSNRIPTGHITKKKVQQASSATVFTWEKKPILLVILQKEIKGTDEP